MKTQQQISEKLMEVNSEISLLQWRFEKGIIEYKYYKLVIEIKRAQRELLNWILGDNFNPIIDKTK